jgi:hypothetical protein
MRVAIAARRMRGPCRDGGDRAELDEATTRFNSYE